MGTNYYARVNCCEKCRKPENEYHIGKKTTGWQFIFEAIDEAVGLKIKSKKEWVEFLYSHDVEIKNEYGDIIEPWKFWEMVEKSKEEKQNHFDYCVKEYGSAECTFKDDEGWAFINGDFS